jgi:nicotinate-nucleotide pyrophosphorylase (carboxylating)
MSSAGFLAMANETCCGLSRAALRELARRALAEDIGTGDVTTQWTLPPVTRARGTLFAQTRLVVAGVPVAEEVFRILESEIRFEPLIEDGVELEKGAALARVEGHAASLLGGERVALNFLQHLAGVATLTREHVRRLKGLNAQLLDTRKTTPGLRALEKYAVRVGGGRNHRHRLDEAILIKSNHATLAGGITHALGEALRNRREPLPIEVEVRSMNELEEAIASGADRALLDNMPVEQVRACVERARGRLELEVSGGITLENIRAYAETGVDFISVGALTHSAPAKPIHFLVERAT